MIISIDFDKTYTADPVLWNTFARAAQQRGFRVICVTARHPADIDEVINSLGVVIGRENCFPTNLEPKRQFMMQNHGIHVDIWIDDMPEMIVENSYLSSLII
jgi:hypothetical protein